MDKWKKNKPAIIKLLDNSNVEGLVDFMKEEDDPEDEEYFFNAAIRFLANYNNLKFSYENKFIKEETWLVGLNKISYSVFSFMENRDSSINFDIGNSANFNFKKLSQNIEQKDSLPISERMVGNSSILYVILLLQVIILLVVLIQFLV